MTTKEYYSKRNEAFDHAQGLTCKIMGAANARIRLQVGIAADTGNLEHLNGCRDLREAAYELFDLAVIAARRNRGVA